MITRPSQFTVLALAMLGVALSFPIQVMVLYGHHWTELTAIVSKITWLNFLVISALLFSAYQFWNVSRSLIYTLPITFILVAFNNYWVGNFGGDYDMQETSIASLAMVGFFIPPLFMPTSRLLLSDPQRRWWRVSKRIKKKISGTINPYVGEMINVQTFDVSETGAFVCLDTHQKTLPKVGETIRLILNINSAKRIRCEAIVIRIADAKGRYPNGMGLKFKSMERECQKSIQQLLDI